MNSAKIDPLDAELLLAHVLNKPREWILAWPEARVCKYASTQVRKLFKKRARGVPLSYLMGHKEFFCLDFIVNRHVLIPRPETEILVEEAIKTLANLQTCTPVHIIDIGTGSGCIPISIIKTLKHKNIKTIAIDISAKALTVAKRNAKKHGVKIKFLHGDLLSSVIARNEGRGTKQSNRQSSILNLKSSIIITANLPYLTSKQFKSSPSIQHEPRLALVAKDNGLALYEKLLKQIKQVTGYRLQVICFLEIDPSQPKTITSLIKSILPAAKIEIIKDLAGLDRIVKVCYTI